MDQHTWDRLTPEDVDGADDCEDASPAMYRELLAEMLRDDESKEGQR